MRAGALASGPLQEGSAIAQAPDQSPVARAEADADLLGLAARLLEVSAERYRAACEEMPGPDGAHWSERARRHARWAKALHDQAEEILRAVGEEPSEPAPAMPADRESLLRQDDFTDDALIRRLKGLRDDPRASSDARAALIRVVDGVETADGRSARGGS